MADPSWVAELGVCDASAIAFGRPGSPRTASVAATLDFIQTPTARSWYRAHNMTIVSAYLGYDLGSYIGAEHSLGHLLDVGIIEPRLIQLYAWSADELDLPDLAGLLDSRQAVPTYGWDSDDVDAWRPDPSWLARSARRAVPPERS